MLVKSKKGLGLVECIVALLLFSVITGAVIVAFPSARKQIRTQNEKFKLDLYESNILSTFQGCDSWNSFANVLRNDLGIETEDAEDDGGVEYIEVEGEVTDPELLASEDDFIVPTPFKRVVVENGMAAFEDSNQNRLVSFNGNYANSLLPANPAYSWNPADLYEAPRTGGKGTMCINGSTTTLGVGNFTWKCDGKKVYFTLGEREEIVEAGEFDKYLYDNGYYLKSVSRVKTIGLFSTNDYFYFKVMNIVNDTPIKDENGKCLYYLLQSTTLNTESLDYRATALDYAAGNAERVYIDFDKRVTLKFCYGKENSTPAAREFTEELKTANGNKFTGKWYYFPWIVAKCRDILLAGSDTSSYGCNITHGSDNYTQFIQYVPKEGVATNIYYSLNSQNTILIFNSDGRLLFPYSGDTEEINSIVDTLKMASPYCKFNSRIPKHSYNGSEYDKRYQKGEFKAKSVTTVKFFDNIGGGASKIAFYSGNTEYFRFIYPADKQADYIADKGTILNFNGSYANYYDYSKDYTILKTGFTDAEILSSWESAEGIKEVLEYNDGYKTDSKNAMFYAKTGGSKIAPKYTYYAYSVTLRPRNVIKQFDSYLQTLTVTHSGTDELTYSLKEDVTASFSKDTLADSAKKGADGKNVGWANITAQKVLYIYDNEVSDITAYAPNSSGSNSNVISYANTKFYETEALEETVDTSRTSAISKPDNFEPNAACEWTNVSATDPVLRAPGAPTVEFNQAAGTYTVKVGGNVVFTSHSADYVVHGDSLAEGSSVSYGVLKEEVDVNAKTYYIVCQLEEFSKSLVIRVTYSNYTQTGLSEEGKIIEPKISIWSLNSEDVPENLADISDEQYDEFLDITYRKG